MSDQYPSLGIRVDLNEFVRLQQMLKDVEQGYVRVGRAKEEAGKAGGQAMAAASSRAVSASKADQQEILKTSATAKQMFQSRMALTRQMFDSQAKEERAASAASAKAAQDTLAFNMRMSRQRAAEAAAADREVVSSSRAASSAQAKAAQEALAFNMRMTKQRAAEAVAAARQEEAAAREVANLQRRLDKETSDYNARMMRQRSQATREWADIEKALMERNAVFRAKYQAQTAASAYRFTGPGIPTAAAPPQVGALAQGWQAVMGAVSSGSSGFVGALGRMRNALGDIRSAFFDAKTAIAVFAGAMVVGPLIRMTDEMTALQARTAFFAARASDVPHTFQAIYKTAQDARAPLEAIGTLYTRLAPLAERLGKSQADILRTTGTVAKGLALGGATSAETSSSSQQLAQALASNRLGGDELRSLAENAPLLLSKIAQSLNMNSGEFIKWAHQGKANAAIVIQAIDDAASSIDRMFKAFPTTISQSLTLVSNAFTHLVSEVNAASGAGGGIAGLISQFAGFLEAQSTIDAVVAGVNGLAVGMQALGKALGYVMDGLPIIAAALTAMAAAKFLPPLFAALAVSVRAFAMSAAIAGPATTAWSISMMTARTASASLLTGLKSLVGFLGGPLGIALIAAGAAFAYYQANAMSAQEAVNKFDDANRNAANALERGITFMNAYGGSTAEMTAIMDKLNGVTSEQIANLDEAGQAAFRRAKNEQALTVSLLERAAAEQISAAAGLRRSATIDRISQPDEWLRARFGIGKGVRSAAQDKLDAANNRANMKDELATRLETSAPELMTAARQVQALLPNITAPAGSTHGPPPADPAKADKGLQRRIAQLNEEIKDSEAATAQIKKEMAARLALTQATQQMYASGLPAAEEYGRALRNQHDAELEAQVAAERAKVFNDDKVKGLADLANQLADAKEATIRATDAQKTFNDQLEASDAMTRQTAETKAYVESLKQNEYQAYLTDRAIRILAKTKELGGNARLATDIVTTGDANDATRADAERVQSRAKALEYARMTADQQEREVRAIDMAVNAMKTGAQSSYDIALNWARTKVSAEQFQEEMAQLEGQAKTSLRDAFSETGKVNLDPLRKQIATKIRQGVYDAMLAGPIDMVVNVAVDVATKGIEKLKEQLKQIFDGINTEGRAGTGNMFENAIGKMLNGMDGFFKKIGGKGGGTASAFLSNTMGGMQVGRAAADAAGFEGSTSHKGWQRIMDTAAAAVGNYFGGPIGAAAATFLSRAVGKAILGKESNYGAIASFDAAGNFTGALGGSKRNDETSGLATSAATGITQGIAALREAGANLTTTVTKLDIGTRDTTHIDFSGGQHLETGVGDAEDAINQSLLLIAKTAQFADPALQAFVDRIEQSTSSIDDLINQISKFTAAQDFVKSIGTANLQYTNPRAYQLAQLQSAQLARRDQLKQYADQGFLTPTQLSAVNAQLQALEQSEIADVVKNFATSVDGAVQSLADFKSAQADILSYSRSLLTSGLSPLSPTDQLQTAGNTFFEQLSKARSGDYGALTSITGTADAYLQQAQGYYGSTEAYAAIFQTVQSALQSLGSQEFEDPLADDIAKASADLQAAIKAAGDQIVAAIAGANDNTLTTASGGLTPDQVAKIVEAMSSASALTADQIAQLGLVLSSTNWQALQQIASQMAGATTVAAALNGGVA